MVSMKNLICLLMEFVPVFGRIDDNGEYKLQCDGPKANPNPKTKNVCLKWESTILTIFTISTVITLEFLQIK